MARRYEKAKQYTEKYKSILAPCKYCGSTGIEITSDRAVLDSKLYWSVTCPTSGCDCSSDTSVKRAIEKWNNRHGRKDDKHGTAQ